jgi:hypothetical protein
MGQNEKGQIRLSRRQVLLAEHADIAREGSSANGRAAGTVDSAEAAEEVQRTPPPDIVPLAPDSVVQTESGARVYRPRGSSP